MKRVNEVLLAALLAVLICLGVRINQIVAIAQTVAENHLVEKGNGAAWPVKITALLGEVAKTSDSVRVSADELKSLLQDDGQNTAQSVRDAAAGLASASSGVQSLINSDGAQTAKSVRDGVTALSGAAGSIQQIVSANGPQMAKSLGDAASAIAGTSQSVQHLIDTEGQPTVRSIRDAASTAQNVLSTELPPTAAAIRGATEHADELSGSWAQISESLDRWVQRITAPPTTKTKILAALHAALIFLAHWLG